MTRTDERDRRAGFLPGPQARIWLLTAAIAVAAVYLSGTTAAYGPLPGGPVRLEWWHLAVFFYVAEVTVVHFQFRRNAHTFSLSEIPFVVGLYLANPLSVIVGHVAGTAVALVFNRRQQPLKLAFNLSQFALVSALSILLFRRIVPIDQAVGPEGWAAVTTATLVGLLIADLLIHSVIRVAGGRLDSSQITEVFAFSAAGAVINSMLGVIAVQLIWADPRNAWLALVAPAVLYVAYRAYASQRQERSRLQAIYLATQRLHASPRIDQAVDAAVGLAGEILDAGAVEVLIGTESGSELYRTARIEGAEVHMAEVHDEAGQAWLAATADLSGAALFSRPPAEVAGRAVAEALAAPLVVGRRSVGAIIVGDRLGDLDGYGHEEAELLNALAAQLSVSLENGKLGESLTAMTVLKEQLESEMEARDQFVASVSHELRTPLTAIMGLASELWTDHGSLDQAETGELLGLIAEQSAELSHIIEDLLVAARADAGNLVIKPELINLEAEAAGVVAEIGRSADGTTIGTALESAEAWADPVRVRQIIRNLLTNAIRYGGDEIIVRAEIDGLRAALIVSDDGDGVPAEAVDQIFQPYQRAHNARGTTESVGLGLAVARSLAQLMGGDLTYRRTDGRTEFVLALPRGDTAPAAPSAVRAVG